MRRLFKLLSGYRLRLARIRDGAADGDAARHHNHWDAAVAHYRRYLVLHPRDIGVKVRLANTLREAGNFSAAITELQQAASARPDKANIKMILADVLEEAGVSSEPQQAQRGWQSLEDAIRSPQALGDAGFARPVPPACEASQILVLIETAGADEDGLQMTLRSLRANTVDWRAVAWDPGADPGHLQELSAGGPVAEHNVDGEAAVSRPSFSVLRIKAGTMLMPDCLVWLAWALDDGVSAVYCDHEELAPDGSVRPVLQSAPHPLDLATNPSPPAVVLYRTSAITDGGHVEGLSLVRAFERGLVRHIPIVLATLKGEGAAQHVDERFPVGEAVGGRILVVVPIRDHAYALDVMLQSMVEKASTHQDIDYLVIDNGSKEVDTFEVLQRWRNRSVCVLRMDEPFNWSRLNNAACDGRNHDILVFANNDVEMLSDEWDLKLRRVLAIGGVGIVGARLLYPNDRVQHAGIVMAGLNGEPLHEALRAASHERGPLDRWIRRRPATAVTGAFLAVRRAVFDQVGGFDAENFAVSCNDVDFCLRAGAAGWTVLYEPELLLRHHESLSRGRSDTEAKQRRAAEEMSRLLERWADRAQLDPTRNPQWVGRGIRLYADCRNLTTQEIMDWALGTQFGSPN